MPDWTKSMEQTFEYYIVDPGTWKDTKRLTTVKSCSITRENDSDTRGSATFDIVESVGECYIRVYLITIQNGVREKHPLGTYLVQTPSTSFDGKVRSVSMDAYTPLLELKESIPPLGYSLLKDANIMENAYLIVRENVRAPVVKTAHDKTLYNDFVANTDDTWITFVSDLIANAKHTLELDELGRILFAPEQDTASLQPVWTFTDDNSSILYPEITLDHDLFGVPNSVEIIYSNGFYNEETGLTEYQLKIVNDDPNSPTSTVSRGREIPRRVNNPNVVGDTAIATKSVIQNYAETFLKELSTLEYQISYTHAYCPVRINDCVRHNHTKAGLTNVKAKVISQNIKCEPGCPVTEKAIFTVKLWR